jgi:lysophospholipase L1-like esterase
MTPPIAVAAAVLTVLLLSPFAMANPSLSFADFHDRASRGEPVSVVFLGGSLTWGANASDPNRTSYRGLMGDYLRTKYPKAPITLHDAAIGGTGSGLAMFRMERDVLAYKPDLVFLDFTINDNIYGDEREQLLSYETIVRQLIDGRIPIVQMLLTDKSISVQAPDHLIPPRYGQHRKLAEAYNLPMADALMHVRRAFAAGRTDAARMYPFDGIHPDDNGYQLFFETARDAYEKAVADKVTCRMAEPVYGFYTTRQRNKLVDGALPTGWTRSKTYRTSMWFDGLSSRWMDDVAVCDIKDKATIQPLRLEFEGTVVSIFGECDQDGLAFKVTIDGQPVAYQPNKKTPPTDFWPADTARFGAGRLFLFRQFSATLAPGKHTVEITPVFPDDKTKGQLRIESICTAGGAK